MTVKTAPNSVIGKMVLDYIRKGDRWTHIAKRMGKTVSYVRYVDHKYNWKDSP